MRIACVMPDSGARGLLLARAIWLPAIKKGRDEQVVPAHPKFPSGKPERPAVRSA